MPPTIHLIRHAQGVHNLGNHHVRDATLTDHGIQQCHELARTFAFHSRTKTIIVSPLRRAVYTAFHALQPAIQANEISMIAHPLFQETGNAPCDTGLDTADLARDLQDNGIDVDLSLVAPGWNDRRYGSFYVNSSLPNSLRAKFARRFLRDLVREQIRRSGDDDDDGSDIVVVSHGGFLHYLTEDWEGAQGHESVAFKNTDYRSYRFVQLDGQVSDDVREKDDRVRERTREMTKPDEYSEISGKIDFVDDGENATMVETEESRRRRGASAKSTVTREENDRLWLETVTKWQNSHVAAGWADF